MAFTQPEKAFCVLEFAKTESWTVVQRAFRRKFGKEPPKRKSIVRWHGKFITDGCLCPAKRTGRPSTSEDVIEQVRTAFQRSPRKSIRRASRELQCPTTTVWRVLRRRLHMTPYKLQLVQQLKDTDKPARRDFCIAMQQKMEDDGFDDRLVFSDEATFHVNGKVNKHNTRIWGTENPHELLEHQRDSPKVTVFCAMSKKAVYGPFFFERATVNGETYLDMLENWLMDKLSEKESGDFIFQQDGAPPHWSLRVRQFLNTTLPDRWIGRSGQNDHDLMSWPPRSPDLTPCDFFLWGFVKGLVYVPPIPRDVDELKARITKAVATIDNAMLGRVWQEFDYRLDVCRVTSGAHIEHL